MDRLDSPYNRIYFQGQGESSMANRIMRMALLVLLIVCLSGCAMKWTPNWPDAGTGEPSLQAEKRIEQARLLFERAKDRDSLLASIAAYKNVLAINSGDYEALYSLSTQYILLGTAYTESRSEKSVQFAQAMHYAELAMYTNTQFREIVDRGATPWEAANVLGQREVEAMFFWVTALQYEFKEGMTLAGKIVNRSWMEYGLTFLNRIEEVAPDFGGGAVEVAKVICYYVLPENKGGSTSKGDEAMALAVVKGEDWVQPRWARGKYYYVIKGEKEKARQDLEWVASRDLNEFKDPTPWKIHFQENAKALLH